MNCVWAWWDKGEDKFTFKQIEQQFIWGAKGCASRALLIFPSPNWTRKFLRTLKWYFRRIIFSAARAKLIGRCATAIRGWKSNRQSISNPTVYAYRTPSCISRTSVSASSSHRVEAVNPNYIQRRVPFALILIKLGACFLYYLERETLHALSISSRYLETAEEAL